MVRVRESARVCVFVCGSNCSNYSNTAKLALSDRASMTHQM